MLFSGVSDNLTAIFHNANMDDLKSLVCEITNQSLSQLSKLEAIYNWITANIAYDVELFARGENLVLQREQWKDALVKRRAICSGYAFLFAEMCR